MSYTVQVTEYQLKLQEAEICYSMGLLNEALELYQQARTASPGQDIDDQEIIEKKFLRFKQRLPIGTSLATK